MNVELQKVRRQFVCARIYVCNNSRRRWDFRRDKILLLNRLPLMFEDRRVSAYRGMKVSQLPSRLYCPSIAGPCLPESASKTNRSICSPSFCCRISRAERSPLSFPTAALTLMRVGVSPAKIWRVSASSDEKYNHRQPIQVSIARPRLELWWHSRGLHHNRIQTSGKLFNGIIRCFLSVYSVKYLFYRNGCLFS